MPFLCCVEEGVIGLAAHICSRNRHLSLVASAGSLLFPKGVQHGPNEVVFGLMLIDALVEMHGLIAV
jgi:hypothetical protein